MKKSVSVDFLFVVCVGFMACVRILLQLNIIKYSRLKVLDYFSPTLPSSSMPDAAEGWSKPLDIATHLNWPPRASKNKKRIHFFLKITK